MTRVTAPTEGPGALGMTARVTAPTEGPGALGMTARRLRLGMFLAVALSATLAVAACGGTTRSGSNDNNKSDSQTGGKANPNAALKTGLKISFLPKQVNNPYFTVADGGGKEAVTELKGEYKETGPSEA